MPQSRPNAGGQLSDYRHAPQTDAIGEKVVRPRGSF